MNNTVTTKKPVTLSFDKLQHKLKLNLVSILGYNNEQAAEQSAKIADIFKAAYNNNA